MLFDTLLRAARRFRGFFVSVITTTTDNAATAYSGQKKGCTLSTGRLLVMAPLDTTGGNGASPFWSDDGITWSNAAPGDPILGFDNGSIDTYVDSSGTERIVVVWKQVGTGGTPARTTGWLYSVVGTFNANRTVITWGTVFTIRNDIVRDFADVVAHAEGTGGRAHIVYSTLSGSTNRVDYNSHTIVGTTQTATVDAAIVGGSYAIALHTYPSIDMDPITKSLFVAWSAGSNVAGKGIRFRKATYSAGSWTWQTERELTQALYINDTFSGLRCMWDPAGRVIIAGLAVAGGTTYYSFILQRDAADTTTVQLLMAALTYAAGNPNFQLHPSAAVDVFTGDVYLIGRNYDQTEMRLRKWKRTDNITGAIQPESNVDATTACEFYPSAWASDRRIHWFYTRGGGSPWQLKYGGIDA